MISLLSSFIVVVAQLSTTTALRKEPFRELNAEWGHLLFEFPIAIPDTVMVSNYERNETYFNIKSWMMSDGVEVKQVTHEWLSGMKKGRIQLATPGKTNKYGFMRYKYTLPDTLFSKLKYRRYGLPNQAPEKLWNLDVLLEFTLIDNKTISNDSYEASITLASQQSINKLINEDFEQFKDYHGITFSLVGNPKPELNLTEFDFGIVNPGTIFETPVSSSRHLSCLLRTHRNHGDAIKIHMRAQIIRGHMKNFTRIPDDECSLVFSMTRRKEVRIQTFIPAIVGKCRDSGVSVTVSALSFYEFKPDKVLTFSTIGMEKSKSNQVQMYSPWLHASRLRAVPVPRNYTLEKAVDIHDFVQNFKFDISKLSNDSQDANWGISGSARVTNDSRLQLNSLKERYRCGIVYSQKDLSGWNSKGVSHGWRIDATFKINLQKADSALKPNAIFVALTLGSKEMITNLRDNEEICQKTGNMSSLESFFNVLKTNVTIGFVRMLQFFDNPIAFGELIGHAGFDLKSVESRAYCVINGTSVPTFETVVISLVSNGTGLFTKMEWWSAPTGVDNQPVLLCSKSSDVDTAQMSMDYIKLAKRIAIVYPAMSARFYREAVVELKSVSVTPTVSVSVTTKPSIPSFVFQPNVTKLEVPLCRVPSTVANGWNCRLDCSITFTHSMAIPIWFVIRNKEVNSKRRINGADGLFVLDISQIDKLLRVGDVISCIIRNDYGYNERQFVVTEALDDDKFLGNTTMLIVLFLGGFFIAAVIAIILFIVLFFRFNFIIRLHRQQTNNVNDLNYALLQERSRSNAGLINEQTGAPN